MYIVGYLRGRSTRKVFPIRGTDEENNFQINESKLKQLSNEKRQGYRVYSADGIGVTLTSTGGGLAKHSGLYAVAKYKGTNRHTGQRVYSSKGVSHTLTTKSHENDVPKYTVSKIHQRSRGYNKGGLKDIAPTVTSNCYQHNNHVVEPIKVQEATKKEEFDPKSYRVRRLTPRECWRLQGFPDWAFDKAKASGVSETQLYKQAGNAVTVNVVEAIAKKLEIYD